MVTTYLVTGANRGIGLQLATDLCARGDQVIATARDPRSARELARTGARVMPLDVADPASVAALAAGLAGLSIDVLVNNAGIGVGHEGIGRLDYARLSRFFETNALGALRVTEALLPNLRAGKRRVVANMTSRMGSIADNSSGGAYAYRASKAALNMLTKNVAIDLAPEGFTCLVLHPGWVQTDMGGPAAPLSVAESSESLIGMLDRATPAQSGAFLDFAGETIPW